MRFWEVMKQALFPDPMAPQIWDCDPLVVVDDDDQVVHAARTRIQVQPREGERFDLEAEQEYEGIPPDLVGAERVVTPEIVQSEAISQYDLLTRGKRRGAAFRGKDAEGHEFTWLINSAADAYLAEHSADDPDSVAPSELG